MGFGFRVFPSHLARKGLGFGLFVGLGVSEGLQQGFWGFLSRVTVESGVCTNALGNGVRDVGAKPGVVLGVTI